MREKERHDQTDQAGKKRGIYGNPPIIRTFSKLMITFLMVALMILPLCSKAFAVTGSEVAKDGTYTATITAKKSGESKTKSATINVIVVDGLISDLTFSGSDAKDFKKYLMGEKGTEGMLYLDQKASADAVDAVSSATQGKAKYTIDLKGAIKSALANAEAREDSGGIDLPDSLEDGVYTKNFTADARYNVTVTVVVSGGKISSISISGDGDWSKPLADAQSNLVGKSSLVGVDAIASATQYSQALEDAILAALTGETVTEEPVLSTYSAKVTAVKTKDGKSKTATVNVTVSNGKIARITFTGGDYDDFEKYLKMAKTGSSKYNMSWYQALVGQLVSEELIVDATSSASLKNASTSSKYKTDLQQALLSALEPLLTKLAVTPEIKSGDNQTYILQSGETITITSTADYDLFDSVTVDGNTVNRGSYTVSSGSTVVELSNSYLDTLSVGDHSVGIVSANGTATATLTVKAAQADPGTDAGKTIKPGESATIYVGETLTLQGTKPSSYGNYHYWYTDEDDVDYIEWDIDNNASPSYYAGTNIANVTGIAAGTVTVYHQYISGNRWVDPGETFTITVLEKDGGGSGSGTGGTGTGGSGEDEEPGDPVHVKAISPEGEVAEKYTISLNVTGQSKTTSSTTQTGETTTAPYDILLVLDNTRSMTNPYGNTTRLAAMKSAAQSFVSGLPESEESKIAMISFTIGNYNSIVTTDVSWTSLNSGKSTVSSRISALNAPDTGYDTYFTQPLERASSLLDSVAGDSNKKYVVFFTDGAAAEPVSTIQNLASAVIGKADATFSIGIVSGSAETQKAQALASAGGNYYDVTTAGTMSSAFASALTTIQSQTTVTKLPMTDVTITDTLSDYVELTNTTAAENYGVTLTASPADSAVTIGSVEVDGKEVKVTLSGDLTDDTVYTVNIPVKPSEKAQTEANEKDDTVSAFDSNTKADLTYRYGTEEEKSTDYEEMPQILVAKEVTLSYDANGGVGAPDSETGKFADAKAETVAFTISETTPNRDGYTFLGWADAEDAAEAKYQPGGSISIDKDTTLYAVWKEIEVPDPDPITISVTKDWADFDADGFTVTAAAFDGDTQVGESVELTKDGGWAGTITLDADTAYTEVRETKITDKDGKDVTDQFTSAASKESGGWSEAGNSPTEGTTYVIGFKSGSDVYVFSVSGTSVVSKKAEVSDGKLTNISAADQWAFTDTGRELGDVTVWTVASSAGSMHRDSSNLSIGEASDIRINKNGYFQANVSAFRSFSAGAEGIVSGNSSTMVTLYTQDASGESWTIVNTPKTYTVTFDEQGHGNKPDPQTVSYSEKASKPEDLTADGYSFGGWFTDSACSAGKEYDFDTPVTEDITLYAKWTQDTYTVTWVNPSLEDSAKTLKTDENVAYNAVPSYDGTTPVKAADDAYTYTFKGWAAKEDAAEIIDLSKEKVTQDVTYYAIFEPVPIVRYTVTYTDGVDGEEIFADQVTGDLAEGTDTPAFSGTPTREGYLFDGWSPAVAGKVTGDAVYTATWEKAYNLTDPVLPKPQETEETEDPGETGETSETEETKETTETEAPADPEAPDETPTNHEELPEITTITHTYEVYQIFTGDYTDMDGDDILTELVWGENGKDPEGTVSVGDPVEKRVVDALNAVVGADLDRTKLNEIEKYVVIDGKPYRTITLKEGDQENSIPLPSGYYLIRDVAESQNGRHDAYTTYITVVIKDYTIQPKSVIPTVDKQVYDNADGEAEAGWSESADHAIGESFQFALIGTIPENEHLKDYTNGYQVTFTDTMSEGVTFESIESVAVNGTLASEKQYTVDGVKAGDAGKTWTLSLDAREILGEDFGKGGISIVVTYNAHLNEKAIVHTASDEGGAGANTNSNAVKMSYSNNPNTGGSGDRGETQTDYVWVFTYQISNEKVDGDGNPVSGAGFRLYQEDGKTEIPLIYSEDKKAYVPAGQTKGVEMTTTAAEDGNKFNIAGLDAGTYILKETKTPPGYNGCEDIQVKISASHEEHEDASSAKLTLTGENTSNKIVNQAGSVLPSTGGTGTRMLYLLGSLLLLGAGCLLIVRRRMRSIA